LDASDRSKKLGRFIK